MRQILLCFDRTLAERRVAPRVVRRGRKNVPVASRQDRFFARCGDPGISVQAEKHQQGGQNDCQGHCISDNK